MTIDGGAAIGGHRACAAPGPGGPDSSRIVVLVALGSNVGVTAVKLVAFLLTGSVSMLAETLHSIADCGNQGLMLLGKHRARLPANAAHPFGFSRERYLWAFVVAVVLFVLGALFSVVEGVQRLTGAHDLDSPAWALTVERQTR